MSLYPSGSNSRSPQPPSGKTEFEILKESHRFLRDDEDEPLTWDEQLARKYYDSLYREFALCDLKHFKSGNFSLRWRTESEVLSGAGETTCGNTRCVYHDPPRNADDSDNRTPPLTTLELPFVYAERGETKSALVKVVLCSRCCKKLMWKRRKEKERAQEQSSLQGEGNGPANGVSDEKKEEIDAVLTRDDEEIGKVRSRRKDKDELPFDRRGHRSRSRSPLSRDKIGSSQSHRRSRSHAR